MRYLWTGNKLLECTCCKQSGKRKPKKKGFTKTASRHVSSEFFLLLGGSSMLYLQWFHSLQKIVFFLLEWPYRESLKLVSQGTQLLYIRDQASKRKNQAFMAKRNKNIFLQPCMPPRTDLFNGLSFIYQGPPKSEKHITLCGHPITKSFNCTPHASKSSGS